MKIQSAGMKHQGKARPHNEDNFIARDDLGLYAVADGVESEPFGEKASQIAVESLARIIEGMDMEADATPPFEYAEGIPLSARALKFAVREVNRAIYDAGRKEEKLRGMSTTLTTMWLREGKAFIGNVGDSRAYIIRRGRIQQLTRDHTTLAQGSASRPARLDFLEDFSSSSEHELTKALGLNSDIDIQLAGGTPRPGDVFLLCTDGLYEDIRDWEIQDTFKSRGPADGVRSLIALANERGGRDNVAVVAVQVS